MARVLLAILVAFLLLAIGGISFWSFAILVIFLRGSTFSGIDIALVTVCPPILVYGTYLLARKLNSKRMSNAFVAALMLLGIWLCGPVALLVKSVLFGPTVIANEPNAWLKAFFLFPIYTFISSAQDLSLLGLIAASITLFVVACRAADAPH